MRLIVFAVAATTRRSCVRGETLKGENPESAIEGFDFAVALERMDERAARKLSGLLGTTVSFPHHRARAGASGGFNRRAAAVPTSIRDRILREHDVDVRLHAWLAARDP